MIVPLTLFVRIASHGQLTMYDLPDIRARSCKVSELRRGESYTYLNERTFLSSLGYIPCPVRMAVQWQNVRFQA
jgi:hypothetical protein